MNVRLNILMVRTPKTDFDRINVYRGFAASPVSQRSDSSTAWCCRQLGLHREIEFTQVQLDLRLLIFSHHSIFPSFKLLQLLCPTPRQRVDDASQDASA